MTHGYQTATAFYDHYWSFRAQRGDVVASNRVKLRHEQAAQHVRRVFQRPTGVRVLDLGCGDGIMGQMLSPMGYCVTGVDVSPRALALAGAHYDSTAELDLDADAVPDQWRAAFDGVVCLEGLEHLERPQQTVRRVLELCRPGGLAVFSFPNLFTWKNRVSFLRGRWPQGYTTYDPREHLQVIELRTFREWVRDASFRVTDVQITPDLPSWRPLRWLMFRQRRALARLGPSLWGVQILVTVEE